MIIRRRSTLAAGAVVDRLDLGEHALGRLAPRLADFRAADDLVDPRQDEKMG